jgi:Putative metal-binding motif
MRVALAWVLGAPGIAAAQTTSFTPLDPSVDPAAWTADLDGDGWSQSDGDCNDADELVHPGRPELCGDRLDNDCDGLFDGGCDRSASLATLQGGGGCTGGQGLAGTQTAAVALLPLWWLRPRRRAGS